MPHINILNRPPNNTTQKELGYNPIIRGRCVECGRFTKLIEKYITNKEMTATYNLLCSRCENFHKVVVTGQFVDGILTSYTAVKQ